MISLKKLIITLGDYLNAFRKSEIIRADYAVAQRMRKQKKLRRFRGKLAWKGDLDQMRIDEPE
jgi:hypothetical protein